MLDYSPGQMLMTILPTVVSCIVGYMLSRMSKAQEKLEKQREEEAARKQQREAERDLERELLRNGVLALLRDRIIQSCNYFIDRGSIKDIALRNISAMYTAYHALGGNDIASSRYHAVLDLPISKDVGTATNERMD